MELPYNSSLLLPDIEVNPAALPEPVQKLLQRWGWGLGGPCPPVTPEHEARRQPRPHRAQGHGPAAEARVGRNGAAFFPLTPCGAVPLGLPARASQAPDSDVGTDLILCPASGLLDLFVAL